MKIFCIIVISISCAFCHDLMAQGSKEVDTSIENGKMIYEQSCLACHQVDGSGVPNLAPPLVKAVFAADTKRLIGIVLQGLQDVEIKGEHYANPMPAFDYLSDQEIADVLTYVRSNFSNSEGPVNVEEVKEARETK